MFKGNRIYIVFLVVCFIALVVIQVATPKPINWAPSYAKKDKIPMGTSALRTVLPDMFSGNKITDVTMPVYNTLKNQNYKNQNLIIINSSFEPDSLDIRELLRFMANGNNVFIAATAFSSKLEDTLKLKVRNYWEENSVLESDSSAISSVFKYNDSLVVNFVNPHLKKGLEYLYTKRADDAVSLSSFDTVSTTVLGKNGNGRVNFIKTKIGDGAVYISTFPEAFINYHFVSANASYVYKALSYLPNQSTFWDEYYKVGNVRSGSPLRVIFENPILLKAYYVLMLSLILFMIIGAKRKQRIIPVIEPYRNTSLEFANVVGTLYYHTGNHKIIADKKITYFLEYIRTTFQTKTTLYDEAFIARIANLSGIEQQTVKELFYYFSDISIKQSITEHELLKLNTMIENFLKQSNR